ncbi:MAG TPA: ThiF family adenylyltransferase [Candidatus Saccharimonadales bacterium]|nr:ThiF family adenylyltransferase [Candidatus Saccharimonadales bacterium]
MGEEITYIPLNKKILGWEEPIILDLDSEADENKLKALHEKNAIQFVSDNIEIALEELYHIEKPSHIDIPDDEAYKAFRTETVGENIKKYGNWVYFPWNRTLVHFPPSEDLRRLRGSRNRNLITEDERKKLINNKTILIAGLSVGSNVVDSLLMQGVGSRYILVDMDSLDPTNLNRIRASYDQVAIHKVDIVAKKISELDPFLEQVHYKNGLDENNLKEILDRYRPDIIVDEMDFLRMKVHLRLKAKEEAIPVVMATDDGDDILLDIERFDLDSRQPILHGILPQEVIDRILSDAPMERKELGAIIGKYFVNLENVPLRMIESLLEVGKTLPSWPQLGGAAVLSGLYVAYAAKKILLEQEINSGRFLMGPEEQLNPAIKSQAYKKRKQELINLMMNR